MTSKWLERYVTWAVGALGLSLLAAFALIGVLFMRLEQTRADLDRVEGGALLSAVQLQAFRDELVSIGPSVTDGLDDAIAGLETFGASSLEFDVRIDETVVIDAEIEVDRDFVVPINTRIPIAQTIETTIEVRGPLGLAVPIDVVVPIELDVPVVLDLTFAVRETIPLKTSVPVHFDLPIEIEIADTGLADLGDSLAAGLTGFRGAFADLAE